MARIGSGNKTVRFVMSLILFVVFIMLAIGFGVVAVILIINDVPYSAAILVVSQIVLWVFAYRGSEWLYRSYIAAKKANEASAENTGNADTAM
ncbi:hypothetical protein [Numidum massiliense]|uniref:hypothetical protein n=1 Tax=Numidum massiliense TaxID=1522315 RepID=UPI0006D52CE9|nr:hypothetical protein [Numidum massiliense]